MRSKLKILILMSLIGHGLFAQNEQQVDSTRQTHKVTVSSALLISAGETTPYWLQANNLSRLKRDAARGALFSIKSEKEAQKRFLDYYYGVEAQFFAGLKSEANLIQSYAGVRIGMMDFFVGMKEESFGLNDATLSIGNLVYGNNARPMPKVAIGTTNWVKAPLFGEIFSFKAYLAHGWFERERYQSQAFLHQKLVYLRATALDKKLSVVAGMHHNVQWGGGNLDQETSQPIGLRNFARIVLGMEGGSDAANSDQQNALGNHLGSYDLSASYQFGKFKVSNYWQFLWEDKSGLTPFNWRDGLIGLSVKLNNRNQPINGFNIELIRTSTQDAVKFDNGTRFVEPDNFFNNGVYRSGWTYQQSMIGNPLFFILNPQSTSPYKIKNMVNAINVGLEGVLKGISYRANYISTKNHGNIAERISPGLRLNLISMQLSKDFGKQALAIRAVAEWGNYPGRNAGMFLSYSRKLWLD